VEIKSIKAVGDAALTISLGEGIDLKVNRQAHALARMITSQPVAGFGECLPAYTGLLLNYDPIVMDFDTAVRAMYVLADQIPDEIDWLPKKVEIPVVYGGESGPDLMLVAEHAGMSPDEVILRHSAADYPVYMMGFTPGFPYLGGMDPRLAVPRLDTPRSRVPAGSVGIAGEQTGIYPLDSPGGWRIIGRTPLRLFDLEADPPCLLAPGDEVRFIPVKAD
jgi:KipI family sensor histidine kinase inhibitor